MSALQNFNPELVLKALPPRQLRSLLVRRRLSFMGTALAHKSLITVTAPAGFGKTSLLSQWRRETMAEGMKVVWLTLDEREDETRLVQGLTIGLSQVIDQVKLNINGLDNAIKSGENLAGLTAWLAEILRLGTPTLLILDDVHTVSADFLQKALWYLILNAPANLQVVMGSRLTVNLPLSEVLSRGHYTDINIEDLRFSPDDIAHILGEHFACEVSKDDLHRVYEHTKGWPLGVQLVLSSLDKDRRKGRKLEFGPLPSQDFELYINDFLNKHLSQSSRDFLISLSCLDGLHAKLCEAMTADEKATELLDDLRLRLPIFTEGINSEWLTMHPMAREVLHQNFLALPQSRQKQLHERAARWLANHDMLESAAQHAIAANRMPFAFELMRESLHGELIRGNQMRVLYWLESLPRKDLYQHPRAIISAAWALAESEHHREAQVLLEPLLAQGTPDTNIQLEAALILAAAAYYQDDIEETRALLSPWREQKLTLSAGLRGIYNNGIGLILLYEGKPEEGRLLIRQGQQNMPTTIPTITGWGRWMVGMTYLWEGFIGSARDELADALTHYESKQGRRAAMSMKLAATLAMVYWESNELAKAEEVLAGRLDLLEKMSAPETISMGYTVAARLAFVAQQEQKALDILENLFALGKKQSILRFVITGLGEQIRLHALLGHGDTCLHLRDRLEDEVAQWPSQTKQLTRSFIDLRQKIFLAYASLGQQDWATLKEDLDQTLSLAQSLRRGRETIEIHLLLALAQVHCRENPRAHFCEAMSLAKMRGVRSTIFHSHPQLFVAHGAMVGLPTLIEWAEMGKGAASVFQPTTPATAHARYPAANSAPKVISGGLLTSKEEEVLLLLAKNLANKEIAQTMNVSPETIKWHIKNLFVKLNAGSRKHVVDRARILGLLVEV